MLNMLFVSVLLFYVAYFSKRMDHEFSLEEGNEPA